MTDEVGEQKVGGYCRAQTKPRYENLVMGTRIDKVTKKDRARQTERGGEDECDVENSGVEERAKEGLVNRTSMLVYSLLCCLFVSIGTGAFVGVSLSNTEAKPTTIAAIGTQPEGTPPSTSNSSPSPTIASPASSPAGNNVTVSPVGSPTSPPTANSLLSPTTQAPTSNVRNFKKGLALHEMQGCNGLEVRNSLFLVWFSYTQKPRCEQAGRRVSYTHKTKQKHSWSCVSILILLGGGAFCSFSGTHQFELVVLVGHRRRFFQRLLRVFGTSGGRSSSKGHRIRAHVLEPCSGDRTRQRNRTQPKGGQLSHDLQRARKKGSSKPLSLRGRRTLAR